MSRDFLDPTRHGFVRIGVSTPRVRPANTTLNGQATEAMLAEAEAAGVSVLVFPELGLSAYAIDDLFQQDVLLDAVEAEIARLVDLSKALKLVFAVGAPLRHQGLIYNTAVMIHAGRVLGVVPKSYLPNYREFYERRWFTPGLGLVSETIAVAGVEVPFGTDLLFQAAGDLPFTAHVEICEDVWTPTPPSSLGALAGAEVLLNLSASNITISKAKTRRLLCGSQSERCIAAYAYSAAGPGESTTDLAWDGHAAVFELGEALVETERFPRDSVLVYADVDLQRIRAERARTSSFGDAAIHARAETSAWRTVSFDLSAPTQPRALARPVERYPYVPSDAAQLAADCHEAWNIQVQGLTERLRATGLKKLAIGVSGGLDSTQALIVATKAMDLLGHPRTNVMAYHPAGVRHLGWHQVERLGADGRARRIRRRNWISVPSPTRC